MGAGRCRRLPSGRSDFPLFWRPCVTLHDRLRALNLADRQVRGLRSRLDARSRRLKVLQTRLDQLLQQQRELDQQHRQTQTRAQTLENEANAAEARVESLRGRMNSVTSNKEYAAILVEVNTLKEEKSKLEDEALAQMSRAEGIQEQLGGLKGQVQEQQVLVDGARAELEAAEAEVRDRLAEVTAERKVAADALDGKALKLYEELSERYEGEAIAEIEEQDRRRREYTCGACYMGLPIERVNAALTQAEVLTTCPSCGRILQAAAEMREGLSAGEKG